MGGERRVPGLYDKGDPLQKRYRLITKQSKASIFIASGTLCAEAENSNSLRENFIIHFVQQPASQIISDHTRVIMSPARRETAVWGGAPRRGPHTLHHPTYLR